MRQPLPKAREEKLLVEDLPDEVVVYDFKRKKAHCLNQTAAIVWKHCDGQTTVPEIARRVGRELKTPVGADVVWLALDGLGENHLLEERIERGPGTARLSRRDAIKVGLAGAVALPLVTSILAPTIAQAATAGVFPGPPPGCIPVNQGPACEESGRIPNGNPTVCAHSSECCSCCCHTNTGDPADAHCTSGTGGVVGCLA